MSMIAKNRIHSTWTPLADDETNKKLFEERLSLVCKWFQKWNDVQRRKLLDELVVSCKRKQLEYARDEIDKRAPCHRDDFTRILPRVITLYVFSFLDSRSLCQCAQVSWYWRYLSELDQLWMPKCLHFGWYLSFTPSPYENGVWKRNFSEQYRLIKALLPKKSPRIATPKARSEEKRERPGSGKKKGPTPWKGSDPIPKDTWRYNYLNNDEIPDDLSKKRNKKVNSSVTDDVIRNGRSKTDTGMDLLKTLARSQSLTRMSSTDVHQAPDRPLWARQGTPNHYNSSKSLSRQNGGPVKVSRPAPVIIPPSRPASRKENGSKPSTVQRSARDPPSSDLFPQAPWRIPKGDSDEED